DDSSHLILIIRFSAASTQYFFPGGITVVALYSVITAGPFITLPGTMFARSRTGVITVLSRKNTGACSTGAARSNGFRAVCCRVTDRDFSAGVRKRARNRSVTS